MWWERCCPLHSEMDPDTSKIVTHGYGLRYKYLVKILSLWKACEQLTNIVFSLGTTKKPCALDDIARTCLLTMENLVKVKIGVTYHFLLDF